MSEPNSSPETNRDIEAMRAVLNSPRRVLDNFHEQSSQTNALAERAKALEDAKIDELADACRFAKVVNTPDGPAVLIGDDLIVIKSANRLYVTAIARALRGGGENSRPIVTPNPKRISPAGFNAAAMQFHTENDTPRPISAGSTGYAPESQFDNGVVQHWHNS